MVYWFQTTVCKEVNLSFNQKAPYSFIYPNIVKYNEYIWSYTSLKRPESVDWTVCIAVASFWYEFRAGKFGHPISQGDWISRSLLSLERWNYREQAVFREHRKATTGYSRQREVLVFTALSYRWKKL